MKTIVVGLGNPLRSDDGVGLVVARALRDSNTNPDIDVVESYNLGLDILDVIYGYDRAILIDAVKTQGKRPGEICYLDVPESTRHLLNPHSIDLATALDLGKTLGLSLPTRICLIGIEVAEVDLFEESCTREVAEAVPHCVHAVQQLLAEEPKA
jgi:hydrogenase maturation protease